MDPATILNLALMTLNAVLNEIAAIKAQSGLTADQINTAAKSVASGNDALYASLVAAINAPTPPSAT